ncbi:fe2+ zn2+ uptake regulation protein [Pseudomonas baetica]|uniref:fe2+ zn2+ uptake regulation protein n=1 Tax=Pseudomonas baetica TaxID=674054 RepID=UPI002406DD8D|nr:fe2+ zn2+ uptake regulation protein [Pseudomonas baetica]MDF9773354.1 Fe2+ or Zn2+ uptake regulation protein [Pseudomonas baetica]
MLNNSGSVTVGAPSPFRTATNQLAFVCNRSSNEHIRELLRFYGLRTSLIRLKVLNALVAATLDGRVVGVRGVHAYLMSLSAGMTFVSVREVLKRLCNDGVIVLEADKNYRITDEAWAMLKQHLDG